MPCLHLKMFELEQFCHQLCLQVQTFIFSSEPEVSANMTADQFHSPRQLEFVFKK